MEPVDLSIIVASYNTKDLLHDCLQSIYSATKKVTFEVIVVDDCSSDGSPLMVKDYFPQAKLICNTVNLRYTKTNNIGLKASSGRYGLLLNSDVIVCPGAFDTLVEFMDRRLDIAAAGPKLINPDGSIQHCIRGFPGLMHMMLQAFGFHKIFPQNPYTERYYNTHFDYNKSQAVDHIGTTAFIIRRSIWEKYGMLDERFDFFMVDFAYCLMLKQKKEKIYYIHDAAIIHYGSVTINMNGYKEISAMHDGLSLFYDIYYAHSHNFLLRTIVRTGIALRKLLKLNQFKYSKNKSVLSGVAFSENLKK